MSEARELLDEPMTGEELAQLGDALLSGDIQRWRAKYVVSRLLATIRQLEEAQPEPAAREATLVIEANSFVKVYGSQIDEDGIRRCNGLHIGHGFCKLLSDSSLAAAALLAQGEALRRLITAHDKLGDDLCPVCDLGSSGEDCHCCERIEEVRQAWMEARAALTPGEEK